MSFKGTIGSFTGCSGVRRLTLQALALRVQGRYALLGGSRVVISGVRSRVTKVISQIRGLITPLITTHEPPSWEGCNSWGSLQGSVGIICFWGLLGKWEAESINPKP